VSDVPLGLLLSGGVDSALLLALMNRHGRHWKTFTVGFGDSFADDELVDARRTAAALGSEHVDVTIDRATFEATLPSIVDILEEPVASASVVPMYFVCQRARQDVTVALMGQGPDELFGGYKRHLGVRYSEAWRRLPEPVREAALRLPAASRGETFRRAAHALEGADRLSRFERTFALLPGDRVDALFADGVLDRDPSAELARCWEHLVPLVARADELSGFQYLEVRSSLPDELLLYADKLSMHHGLEIRVPFLDQEIIEYATRLAPSFKVRQGRRKWLHKRVAASRLPAEIIRRRKRGFAVNVVDTWLRDSVGSGMVEQLQAADARIYDVLRRDEVVRLLDAHREGRADHHKVLFSLVVLETWLAASAGRAEAAAPSPS
jgi:asparagine synthase (glutamine-hydrolysing)